MKKMTLIMLTSASMLFAVPAMASKNMQNKCMNMTKGKHCKKMIKKHKMGNRHSPFLIQKGLPHLNKMIMPYYDDPSFNLTVEQKEKLDKVRNNTMGVIMEIKPKVMRLRKEIINASTLGTSFEELKERVAKLSLLQATATLTHLKCIEETKTILTKDQLLYMLVKKNNKMKHRKQRMRNK